ncbi:hypothetical protein [Halorarius litoreus]|uniref:hypothetical protein n=1 Tax=Halorarius litoreus TaxID=2962676 RepID=UPI0020CC7C78|nr:hypothetical protein [Halorarius litoreus]
MRVLIVPELYRSNEASANATLNDAVTWVREWLRQDSTIHVYWLLPHRATAAYEREDVLADRDRVTLIEAEPFMGGTDVEYLFTESGFTEAQLLALKQRIYDDLGYVDVVIDQLRHGEWPLQKWLLYLSGRRAGEPKPFDYIVNVHDLLLPFKYPGDGYRDDYHRKMEVTRAVLADGCWFKAGLDAAELPVFGSTFLPESVIESALDASIMTDSPIDFSRFEERYSEEPRWLHIAGSNWEKKHQELIMEIACDLHRNYEMRTVITSMGDIPEEYTRHSWVEAHPSASWEEYERVLEKGDIAISATEYDTLARTWFEQAASGQVLIIRDEPWVRDCVPADSPLVAPVDQLLERARWVVEHWDDAVAANRRMMAHVREVRNPERTGRKTLDDMTWRVAEKVETYAAIHSDADRRAAVGQAISELDAAELTLAELVEFGEEFTADSEPLLSHDWCTLTDLVFLLRAQGYRDVGNPGTPVFRRAVDEETLTSGGV